MPGIANAAPLVETLARGPSLELAARIATAPVMRRVALIVAGVLALAAPQRALRAQDTLVAAAAPRPALQASQELLQLVAPIALYPDALVAQILIASTYPTQVVDADRWMQQSSGLTGKQLGDAVNGQSWDPSVKALTQFPSVLSDMGQNISLTSSLGEAYVNQQQDVMDAVQVMRQRAQQAGTLQSGSQELVTTQDNTIVIQPANPDVVYVRAYDPWTIYGAPLEAYPGWVRRPGIYYAGHGYSWGRGIDVGQYAGYGWGWRNWGFDWRRHDVLFNHDRYLSRSTTFIDRRPMIERSPAAFRNNDPAAIRGEQVAIRGEQVATRSDPGSGMRGDPPASGGTRGDPPVGVIRGDPPVGVIRGDPVPRFNHAPTVFAPDPISGIGGYVGTPAVFDPLAARGYPPPYRGYSPPYGGYPPPYGGYPPPYGGGGLRSGFFSGFGHGGMINGYSNRGLRSFYGGGFRGYGGYGGFRGGDGFRGGGRPYR